MSKILPAAFAALGLFCTSCSSENLGNWFTKGSNKTDFSDSSYSDRAAATMYDNSSAALLMSAVSNAPSISDSKAKKDISQLQYLVKGYLKSFEDFNEIGKKRYEKAYRKCYQSLQARRKSLSSEDNEKLGQYLAGVKSKFSNLQERELRTVEYPN